MISAHLSDRVKQHAKTNGKHGVENEVAHAKCKPLMVYHFAIAFG